MPPFEVLLPVGAIALYLFDSTILLYANELMFLHDGSGWDCLQRPRLLLFGRRLWFPNPFAPQKPQFRVRWSESDARLQSEDTAELVRFLAALRPLQVMAFALLILLVLLPVELLVFGTGVELLILFATYYGLIIVALVYVFIRRAALRISGRGYASLVFECLACSPFAVNLVRKVTMRRSLAGNPLTFAQAAFDSVRFERLIQSVSERVREEQQHEDEQQPRWSELEAYRQKLLGMLPRA